MRRRPDGQELAILFVMSALMVLVFWQVLRAVHLLTELNVLRL